MTGDSGFLLTQKILRSGLPRNARLVMALIRDEAGRLEAKKDGAPYPEWSVAELAVKADMSPSTVKRALRTLEAAGFVQCVPRPGLPSIYVPRMPGQPAAPLPQLGLPMGEGLTFVPRTYAIRGKQGRFVAVGDPQNVHRFGQIDRGFSTGGSVKLTEVPTIVGAADDGGSVKLTEGFGQIDRGGSVKLTEVPAADVPVLRDQRSDPIENAALRADPRAPEDGHLPLPPALALTAEQRYRLRHDPAADANYKFFIGRALELARADPPPGLLELHDRVRDLVAPLGVEYALDTPEGRGVLHMAVTTAWRILEREGVVASPAREAPRLKWRRGR